jgi:hypothetical protein
VALGQHSALRVDERYAQDTAVFELEREVAIDEASRVWNRLEIDLTLDAVDAGHRQAGARHALKAAQPIRYRGKDLVAPLEIANTFAFFDELHAPAGR